MQDREEAIRWLTEHGYLAFARDCALGEAIVITKRVVELDNGLRFLEPDTITVYPSANGSWNVGESIIQREDIPFADLQKAVLHAVELLEAQEPA